MNEHISKTISWVIKVTFGLIVIYALLTWGVDVEKYFTMLIEAFSNG